ncbi:MAG: histidine kinase [Acholeplasmataceae bacterium]|nr:histidine kinase [Acholeplasmataceae bacterium]
MFEIESNILLQLWLGLSLFLVIILILNRTDIFKNAIFDNTSFKNRFTFIAIFSTIGILGTYWGIQVPGGTGVINTRAVGVIVGGLIGGPVVGTLTGLITGIHRIFSLDTFSAFGSGIITILQGIIAGFLSYNVKKSRKMWPLALFIGFFLELLHMVLLFVFPYSFEMVYNLVRQIAPAMLVTNPLAIALFIGILEDTYKREEKIASEATKTSFKIINLTMNLLKNGFNESSAQVIASAITHTVTNFSWVALFYNKNLVALEHNSFKRPNEIDEIISKCTKEIQADKINSIMHVNPYIILPIYNKSILLGHVILGKDPEQILTKFELDLAMGLRDLISLQIEINEYKEQAKLLANAEIKALQSQINPHFLFNALNTIGFHCRDNPMTAKKLISSLADYYRHNLSDSDTLITFNKEMEHVKAYVNIEMARFGDRLQVKYDFPLNYEFKIPSLIMQPLVENAIKHGILTKEDGGIVSIKVTKYKKHYELFVVDDGVGIPPKELGRLLLDDPGRQSIGLINVHKRLISIYGADSGLNIESTENKGTTVSFKIPLEGA